MRRVFDVAHSGGRRIVFAEGEDERVLHAAFAMIEERVGKPILIGRPDVIEARCERAAIPLKVGRDFELVNPENDPRYRDYWGTYHALMQRRGVTPDLARAIMRTNTTAIGAVMVHRGEADSLICGTFGQYLWHLNYVRQVLAGPSLRPIGALSLMIHEKARRLRRRHPGPSRPDPEEIADVAIGAARHARRFGVTPKVALCSHSQFGNLDTSSGRRMRGALALLDAQTLDFDYEGEMHSDAALDPELRDRLFPQFPLRGSGERPRLRQHRRGLRGAQHPQDGGGRPRGRADPDGHGQQGPHRHALDHRARAPQHRRARGDAGAKLRLSA